MEMERMDVRTMELILFLLYTEWRSWKENSSSTWSQTREPLIPHTFPFSHGTLVHVFSTMHRKQEFYPTSITIVQTLECLSTPMMQNPTYDYIKITKYILQLFGEASGLQPTWKKLNSTLYAAKIKIWRNCLVQISASHTCPAHISVFPYITRNSQNLQCNQWRKGLLTNCRDGREISSPTLAGNYWSKQCSRI
jgi:hypothetical protein